MTRPSVPGDSIAMIPTPMISAPLIVLDTNVCLDLFVFEDARCRRLHAALLAGEIVAVTDDACREEWLRVLRYPQLALDDARREIAAGRFDAAVRHCAPVAAEGHAMSLRCRDPHDQKFLDLAMSTQARWLLSRDDHLLSLARRAQRAGLFEILTPLQWIANRAE